MNKRAGVVHENEQRKSQGFASDNRVSARVSIDIPSTTVCQHSSRHLIQKDGAAMALIDRPIRNNGEKTG
jgi:hypothetical protein